MLFAGYGALDGIAFTCKASGTRPAKSGFVAVAFTVALTATAAAWGLRENTRGADANGPGRANTVAVRRGGVFDAELPRSVVASGTGAVLFWWLRFSGRKRAGGARVAARATTGATAITAAVTTLTGIATRSAAIIAAVPVTTIARVAARTIRPFTYSTRRAGLSARANACDGAANNDTGRRIGPNSTAPLTAVGSVFTISDSVANDLARFTAVLFALPVNACVSGFTRWLLDTNAVNPDFIRLAVVRDTGAALLMLPNRTRIVIAAHSINSGLVGTALRQTCIPYLICVGIAHTGTRDAGGRLRTDEAARPCIGRNKADRVASRACPALRGTGRVNGY